MKQIITKIKIAVNQNKGNWMFILLIQVYFQMLKNLILSQYIQAWFLMQQKIKIKYILKLKVIMIFKIKELVFIVKFLLAIWAHYSTLSQEHKKMSLCLYNKKTKD